MEIHLTLYTILLEEANQYNKHSHVWFLFSSGPNGPSVCDAGFFSATGMHTAADPCQECPAGMMNSIRVLQC